MNYRLIEEQSQTFNEDLFLPYSKLNNKCIWKKCEFSLYVNPLSITKKILTISENTFSFGKGYNQEKCDCGWKVILKLIPWGEGSTLFSIFCGAI